MSPKLLLVGGGRMGAALVGGLVAGGWADPASLAVLDTDPGARERIAASHPGVTVVAEPVVAEGVVLAVKPDVAEAACRSMMSAPPRRLLSVVAGLSTARLAAALPPGTAVVRAMPNTPALVGAGVSVISGGDTATSADLDWAESVLGSVGTVVRLPERYLDAVTGLSGSGPAYVFLVAEALIDAGVMAGLPPDVSRDLAIGTIAGAAKLLVESGDGPADLRAAVTSPAGTTAAGIRTLEFKAVRSAFIEAVAAATERSRQLGR